MGCMIVSSYCLCSEVVVMGWFCRLVSGRFVGILMVGVMSLL